MSKSETLILIPAYNESETIKDVILSSRKYGHVIVLDDASTDETREKALQAGALVLTNAINLGYEKNLSSGIKSAINDLKYSFLITIDGDGEHNPDDISRFTSYLINGMHLVCGNRSSKNRFSEHAWSSLGSIFYGIQDPLCGLKGYSLEFIRNHKQKFSFESLGSCIGTCLTKKMINLKCKTTNLEITVSKREGESKFGSGLRLNLRMLWELIKFLRI